MVEVMRSSFSWLKSLPLVVTLFSNALFASLLKFCILVVLNMVR